MTGSVGRLFKRCIPVLFVLHVATVLPVLGQASLPEGKGADLMHAKCRSCHGLELVTDSAGISRAMWSQVMREMEEEGLLLTPAESEIITWYLVTYLGPDPPPENGQDPVHDGDSGGPELYTKYCGSCHGPAGRGAGGQAPPLADNPHLFNDGRYSMLVILYGLNGEIEVRGRNYSGIMPEYYRDLSDEEVAAIINHILTAWGNRQLLPAGFEAVSAEGVSRLRNRALSGSQVRKYRDGAEVIPLLEREREGM